MNNHLIDPLMVLVLLLNFFILASTQVRAVIYAAALQGMLLAAIYPLAHGPHQPQTGDPTVSLPVFRMVLLTFAMLAIKGWGIPRQLLRAIRDANIRWQVESVIGFIPSLLIGAVGTGASLAFASTLPLLDAHTSHLVVPASLATVLTGFVILTTRRTALSQVLGYVVLENGIFIFGLLLVEALPALVEVGVLLDLFVGVFVMGIIIHHVNRELAAATSTELSTLRE